MCVCVCVYMQLCVCVYIQLEHEAAGQTRALLDEVSTCVFTICLYIYVYRYR